MKPNQPNPGEQQEAKAKLSNDILSEYGFVEISTFNVLASTELSLGRNRYLCVGCAGSPNEMMFICEGEKQHNQDVVTLHNWDYDGWLTIEKIQQIYLAITGKPLDKLTTPKQHHQ